MIQAHTLSNTFGVALALGLCLPGAFGQSPAKSFTARRANAIPMSALWNDRGDAASLNLLDGPGNREHRPSGKFTFVKEDKSGTSPKFDVVDEQGVHWKAKLGQEPQSETAATRLVWAAGYFADEDYYRPELHVNKLPKLSRGREFVSPGGVVRGVRLERKLAGEKKGPNWSWFKNPFMGTREMNGLKIMMALINNWDLKEINNTVYREKGLGARYVVTDLGASFGETGNSITRSKSNPNDYGQSKFIQRATAQHVDFILSSRPFVLSAVDVGNYVTRTHMQDIVKDIPVADARWLGKLLEPLSDDQIRDCFRAAGYSPEQVDLYTSVVRERIQELSRL